MNAQKNNATSGNSTDLPYYEIGDYPDSYSAKTVAARMIDGLGFRYYWGTEGLREEDLAFRPNSEARTSAETIDHILGLTRMIVNAMLKVPNEGGLERPEQSFAQKRKETLENLKKASDILMSSKDGELSDFVIVFKNGDQTNESPFWNLINGPIEDAVWHVGQVVSFRRSSGNPLPSGISVFSGKVRR